MIAMMLMIMVLNKDLEHAKVIWRCQLIAITSDFNLDLCFYLEYARQGYDNEVGKECIKEYDKGYEAGLSNRPMNVRSNNKLAHCYRTGYQDGQFF